MIKLTVLVYFVFGIRIICSDYTYVVGATLFTQWNILRHLEILWREVTLAQSIMDFQTALAHHTKLFSLIMDTNSLVMMSVKVIVDWTLDGALNISHISQTPVCRRR